MKIQHATEKHLNVLYELERSAAFHHWSEDAIRATLQSPANWSILALRPHPVGYLIAQRVLDQVEILTLGVHPNHRRQGVASTLLRYAQASWIEDDIHSGFLEVRENNPAAIKLYLQHGWQKIGRRSNYYGPKQHALNLRWMP